ncbi:hypothetical protein ACGFI9_31500 [Micromonospora sp. NPDC048930]|uniref:hypothetical protein n=1 Tax=Micromonospora sp. NPDC048930 TaxID=3364261 RepID=UPI00372387FA
MTRLHPRDQQEIRLMHDAGYPFDTANRAYQRFLSLASDHFEVLSWDNATTGRPTLITLTDIGSRDTFSLALLDSVEDRAPHALLAVTTTGALSLHGPVEGRAAAADYAPHLAMRNPDIAATTPVALHDPTQARISDDEWTAVPPDIVQVARTTTVDAPRVALALLDRDRARLAVVGPFATLDTADAWQPEAAGQPPADRLLLPMHAPNNTY